MQCKCINTLYINYACNKQAMDAKKSAEGYGTLYIVSVGWMIGCSLTVF